MSRLPPDDPQTMLHSNRRPGTLTRRAPPKRGIVGPSGGFGLLVDGALSDLGEGFISSLLFLKCLF